MTDRPRRPGDSEPDDEIQDGYDERAAAAFRTAFKQHSSAFAPPNLDVDPIVAASRRHSWWRTGMVAAAVLTLVGATAIGVSTLSDGGSGDPAAATPSGTYASDPTGSTDSGTSEPTPTIETAATTSGPLPDPEPGWRYVSYRDVVLQVPESWGYADAPGPDWCAYNQGPGDPPFPTEPYVATPDVNEVVLSIACPTESAPGGARDFEAVPPEYWAPHLDLSDLGDRNWPGESVVSGGLYGAWTFTEARVGDVVVTVLTNPETAPLADRIIASARQVETDHNGCDATSPAQARKFVRPRHAFDVDALQSVDWISVCQYDRGDGTRGPGLIGSRLLIGADADAELAAIQQAPLGGGPDTPEHCVDDMFGDTSVVLRLHAGRTTYDVYVYYDWCFGNGFDDGTSRRELTVAACLPIWAPPVEYTSGSSAPYRACHA